MRNYIVIFLVCILFTPVAVSAQQSSLELQIQNLLKQVAVLQEKLNQKTVASGIVEVQITPSVTVPAQRIDRALPRQVLGGYDLLVQGESIVVSNLVFTIKPQASGITSVYLYNTHGDRIAGPGAVSGNTVTFAGPLQFRTGSHTLVVRGTLNNSFENGEAIELIADISLSKITGAVTGRVISPKTQSVSGNSMTVVSAGLTLTPKEIKATTTVADGTNGVVFGEYTLSAKKSSEPVRVESLSLRFNAIAGDLFGITGCMLHDSVGAPLMEERSRVNPRESNKLYTFTMSPPIVVSTSTDIVITLKCNTGVNNSGMYTWGVVEGSRVTAFGLRSGSTMAIGIVPEESSTVTVDQTRHALISHWDFNTDGQVITDIVGINNGLLKEATTTLRVNGKHGKALSLYGEREYVEIPHSNSLRTNSGAIALYVLPKDSKTSGIFAKGDGCVEACFSLSVRSNSFVLEKKERGVSRTILSGFVDDAIATGTWYHILVQFNPEGSQLYVNGELTSESDVSLDLNTNLYPITLGKSGFTDYFKGNIDDVRIYNRELTDEEIRTLSLGLSPGIAEKGLFNSILGSVFGSVTQKDSFLSSVISLFLR
ncbi:MAG: LamG domain-containing protein [Candidatus Paceibacterota bacterium]